MIPPWVIGVLGACWLTGVYIVLGWCKAAKRGDRVLEKRVVGICGACGGPLTLYPTQMVAECSCGATRIPRPFFERARGQG